MKFVNMMLRTAPALLLLASVSSVQGALSDPCAIVPGAYVLNNLTGVGGGCTLGDKVYSNFQSEGLTTNQVQVTFNILDGNEYQLVFQKSQGFSSNFTLSYDISVLTPGKAIIAADAQGNYPFPAGASVLTVDVRAAGMTEALFVSTPAAADPGPQGLMNPSATITVRNSFVYGGETLAEVSNSVIQGDISQEEIVPEPGTYALMGSALVGLALLRRKFQV